MARDTPNPGSDEAIEQGCTCPVFDNHHGAGFRGNPDHFAMMLDCPLHGDELSQAQANTDARKAAE